MTAGGRPPTMRRGLPRRTPRRVVVDASVALKWQLPDEDFIAQAAALRDDYLVRREVALVAPSLFLYEVTNAIGMAAKRARVSADVADEALANLVAANIELFPPEPARMLRLCRRFSIAAYDAAYVALALQLRADLWTGDRPLYEAARGELASVRWIGDYPLPG
ncbi:MAG: type II toxin-antitoxin system VapC family toxin [Dehalococcoidia bacterium]